MFVRTVDVSISVRWSVQVSFGQRPHSGRILQRVRFPLMGRAGESRISSNIELSSWQGLRVELVLGYVDAVLDCHQ
jgi:hypothetical protein